jgi:hypothetical protein
VDSCLVEDCEDKKFQQRDLRVSFALDVVVVAFMNTEGPLVPFPISKEAASRIFAINTMYYNNSFFLIY